jgi:hypothetical protein
MEEQDTTSPFFEGVSLNDDSNPNVITDEKKLPSIENEYTKLKRLLPTSKKHMSFLLELYKFCFELHSTGKEKTTDEVVDEIANLGSNLDIGKIFAKQLEELKKQELDRRLFSKRVEQISNFINYAYAYYVWFLDSTAPICKLPTTLTKYRLISKLLKGIAISTTVSPVAVNTLDEPDDNKMVGYTIDTLDQLFEEVITDKFIADLRVEQPPFLIRTDLQPDEIKQKIETSVKPLCKKVLAALLKLDKK